MPNKEAVVLILDANESMASEVAMATETGGTTMDNHKDDPVVVQSSRCSASNPKTRFDCAKEASMAILSDLMVRSKTNEATVLLLHTETTNNYFFEEDESTGCSDDDEYGKHFTKRGDGPGPFPNITELSGTGKDMGIRQPLPDLLRTIDRWNPTAARRDDHEDNDLHRHRHIQGGDFESGLVYAADTLHRRTAGKKFDRRIVLLTDAEHRVTTADDSRDSDSERMGRYSEQHSQQRLLVALDQLRAMECRIQVVGMDFAHAADFDAPISGPAAIKEEQIESEDKNSPFYCTNDGDDDDDDNTEVYESDDDDDDDDGDEDIDILEIKRENEKYLIRLANMTGGFVYSSKELQATIDKVLGSRVVQNPSKRKLIVEIAPGLVLEDARYYKLISKTAGLPTLTKKLSAIVPDGRSPFRGAPQKNTVKDERIQDYETTITHWNPEDENEELLKDRLTYAYRFGSDLLPFTPLDEQGLKGEYADSPVKLTILGYVPDSSIPRYLLVNAPYVLTGHESRRCCAAISALAAALYQSEKVAIATFVQTKGKDPILCGLFPILEHNNVKSEQIRVGDDRSSNNTEPLRLIIMQLPFSGDVRYPHLDGPTDATLDDKSSSARSCDDLIDALMLPDDALDYTHIPNHKVRSYYKTMVKRVLDKRCDVVSTRIDDASGRDSMDTPLEIQQKAKHAVGAFYDSFPLSKQDL